MNIKTGLKNVIFLQKYFKSKLCKKKIINKTIVFLKIDEIGDFILSLSAMEALSGYYRDWKKILICNSTSYEFAKCVGFWDEIITFDRKLYKKSVLYRMRKEKEIMQINADTLLNMQYSRNVYLEVIALLIQAKHNYAFDGDTFLTKFISKLSNKNYERLIFLDENIMELRKNIQFAEMISGEKLECQSFSLGKYIDKYKGELEQFYFVVVPGGSYWEKSWETKKFAELIEMIWDAYRIPCYLLGTCNEKILGCEIIKYVQYAKIHNFIGETSLIEYAQIIANSGFVIGNDSSAIHIAAALKVQSFAIAGGWYNNRFLPYDCDNDVNEKLPLVIRIHKECYGCALGGKKVQCKEDSRRGKIFECISLIQSNDVFCEIQNHMDKYLEMNV